MLPILEGTGHSHCSVFPKHKAQNTLERAKKSRSPLALSPKQKPQGPMKKRGRSPREKTQCCRVKSMETQEMKQSQATHSFCFVLLILHMASCCPQKQSHTSCYGSQGLPNSGQTYLLSSPKATTPALIFQKHSLNLAKDTPDPRQLHSSSTGKGCLTSASLQQFEALLPSPHDALVTSTLLSLIWTCPSDHPCIAMSNSSRSVLAASTMPDKHWAPGEGAGVRMSTVVDSYVGTTDLPDPCFAHHTRAF